MCRKLKLIFPLTGEWFGGLSAVALTDCVQGLIMIFGAIAVCKLRLACRINIIPNMDSNLWVPI